MNVKLPNRMTKKATEIYRKLADNIGDLTMGLDRSDYVDVIQDLRGFLDGLLECIKEEDAAEK
jgi:hypothetical protein